MSTVRVIQVKVKAKARASVLEETSPGVWHAELKSPPVDGKANKELIALVARTPAAAGQPCPSEAGPPGA